MTMEIETGSAILIFLCFFCVFFAPPKLPVAHGPRLLEALNLAPGSHAIRVPEFYPPPTPHLKLSVLRNTWSQFGPNREIETTRVVLVERVYSKGLFKQV